MIPDFRCERDNWLSECILFNCYNVAQNGSRALETLISTKQPLFISAKIDTDANRDCQNLQDAGFKKINQQLTFRWSFEGISGLDKNLALSISSQKLVDVYGSLEQFALLFSKDRFSGDTRLPKKWSAQIKTKWLTDPNPEKEVILAKIGGVIAGFILIQPKLEFQIIDLIAVQPKFRSQGIGKSMLRFMQNNSCKNGTIVVGTQQNNVAARRLYTETNFKAFATKNVYHYYNEGEA